MIGDNLLDALQGAEYLADVFGILFQTKAWANPSYSSLVNFSEHDFVVAGVGARAGLQECFAPKKAIAGDEVAVTRWMAEHQVRPARLAGKHGPSRRNREYAV